MAKKKQTAPEEKNNNVPEEAVPLEEDIDLDIEFDEDERGRRGG